MLIVSCSHGKHLGRKIASKLKAKHSLLKFDKFPDGEIGIKFNVNLRGRKIVLVQSFYGEVSDSIIEVILAAKTAKELKAKRVILVAPYFPYLRQDKRFHAGEAVSQRIMGELFDKYFDKIYVMDPHLHRTKSLRQIFKRKSKNITAMGPISEYIKKKIKNPVIIGPDSESYQWTDLVAENVGVESRVLTKKRYSSYNVKVTLDKKLDLNGRSAVIVDDIVSTGGTIIEASKILRKLGAKKIYCICTHGVLIGGAIEKLKRNNIEIISTNTIPNKVSKIDISGVIAEKLN